MTDDEFDLDERPESGTALPTPQTVVWRLLRDAEQVRRERRQAVRAELARRHVLADDVSLGVHQLGVYVAQHRDDPDSGVLEAIAVSLTTALTRAGVRLGDPVGRPWTEVRDWSDPLPGGPAVPADELVVRATVVPAVWAGGDGGDEELLRRARVEVGRREVDDEGERS